MSPKYPSFSKLRPTSSKASKFGRGNRAKNTSPELILRRALWKKGVRYRLHPRNVPGKPDLVVSTARVAVFCDGDFWHGRNWEERRERLRKGSNAAYWVEKISRNIARDSLVTETLQKEGWLVVRIWESDVKGDPEAIAKKIAELVLERRNRWPRPLRSGAVAES
jgi:DNA mismatch endonuclease, patch repair protein